MYLRIISDKYGYLYLIAYTKPLKHLPPLSYILLRSKRFLENFMQYLRENYLTLGGRGGNAIFMGGQNFLGNWQS